MNIDVYIPYNKQKNYDSNEFCFLFVGSYFFRGYGLLLICYGLGLVLIFLGVMGYF